MKEPVEVKKNRWYRTPTKSFIISSKGEVTVEQDSFGEFWVAKFSVEMAIEVRGSTRLEAEQLAIGRFIHEPGTPQDYYAAKNDDGTLGKVAKDYRDIYNPDNQFKVVPVSVVEKTT